MAASAVQSTVPPPNAEVGKAADLESLPLDRVLVRLNVKPDEGLASGEAAQRLAKHGPNALVVKEEGLVRKLLGHFTGPIAFMIEAAAIVSAIIGHWSD